MVSDGLLKDDKSLQLSSRPQRKHLYFESTQFEQKHLAKTQIRVLLYRIHATWCRLWN